MRVAATFIFANVILAAALGSAVAADLQTGPAQLRSAGPIAFSPDGILFVGDTAGAALWALDTDDSKPGSGSIDIAGIDAKVAAMLGVPTDEVAVNDLALHPVSGRVYLSVSRGRGPDAAAVILRTGASGKLEELSLESIRHSRVGLSNAPAADAVDRRGASLRVEAITDLHYVDGKVFVAGLSNEEFASNLRAVDYPFTTAGEGTSVEIYHGNHAAWETRSPVRTFVPYRIGGVPHLLAAYTCTPLVTFPVKSLTPGTKVVGKTVAELGNRNRPLDMIVYAKGGAEFILMSNSSRGVMKMSTKGIGGYDAITNPVEDKEGVPYETIETLTGVEQLDKLDDARAVILARSESGALDLRTIALP